MQPRRIFITGAGRGVGRALTQRFLDAGHTVYGSTNRTPIDLEITGSFTIDMGDEASILAAGAELANQTDAIDTLINCAGVDARAFGGDEGARGPFDVGADIFNSVMNVNVTGPMALTTALLPLLKAGTDSMIINISSQLGSMEVGATMGRDTVYCVSKAALNMLSVKTASALKPDGIGVVMMHPGWVQTDMGGSAAALTIDEAADAIDSTISSLTFADTGRFLRWDGSEHPW